MTDSDTTKVAFEALTDRLYHLEASLNLIYGEGLENFTLQNDRYKDAYLCGCARLVQEAQAYVHQLQDAVYRGSSTPTER